MALLGPHVVARPLWSPGRPRRARSVLPLRRFDEFVTEVDLHDLPWEQRRPESMVSAPAKAHVTVDWERLESVVREVAGLPQHESLLGWSHRAARARRLVAAFATGELGLTYSAVGERLGMRATSVFNLVSRSTRSMDLPAAILELRRELERAQ